MDLSKSSHSNILEVARDSVHTVRITGSIAFIPILFTMLSHVIFAFGRWKHAWIPVKLAIFSQVFSKVVSIPLGLGLIVAGIIIAHLDLTVTGIALLTVIYTADIGSWDAAYRLAVLVYWVPRMFCMSRWHTAPNGLPWEFNSEDSYGRVSQAIHRLIARANTDEVDRQINWRDELIIAILSVKFVSLTDDELNWKEMTDRKSVREIITCMGRWEAGWNGLPGKWVRTWTHYEQPFKLLDMESFGISHRRNNPPELTAQLQDSQAPERCPEISNHELTLRFIIVIYECLRRSKISDTKTQMKLLHSIAMEKRDIECGSMKWFPTLLRTCLQGDQLAIERSVGNELSVPSIPKADQNKDFPNGSDVSTNDVSINLARN